MLLGEAGDVSGGDGEDAESDGDGDSDSGPRCKESDPKLPFSSEGPVILHGCCEGIYTSLSWSSAESTRQEPRAAC